MLANHWQGDVDIEDFVNTLSEFSGKGNRLSIEDVYELNSSEIYSSGEAGTEIEIDPNYDDDTVTYTRTHYSEEGEAETTTVFHLTTDLTPNNLFQIFPNGNGINIRDESGSLVEEVFIFTGIEDDYPVTIYLGDDAVKIPTLVSLKEGYQVSVNKVTSTVTITDADGEVRERIYYDPTSDITLTAWPPNLDE